MTLKANLNEYVVTYDQNLDGNATASWKAATPCNLGVIGTESCSVDYKLHIFSQNGTVAFLEGESITFISECLLIKQIDNDNFNDNLVMPANYLTFMALDDQYEVRGDPVAFDLPYLDLNAIITSAASEDDAYIVAMCGNIVYSVEVWETLDDALDVPTNEAFVFTQRAPGTIESGELSLYTIDQSYAVPDFNDSSIYEKEYTLKIIPQL